MPVSVGAAETFAKAFEDRFTIALELRFCRGYGSLICLDGAGVASPLVCQQLSKRSRQRGLAGLQERLGVLVKLSEVLRHLHVGQAQCRAVSRRGRGIACSLVGPELLEGVLYGDLILLNQAAVCLHIRWQCNLSSRRHCESRSCGDGKPERQKLRSHVISKVSSVLERRVRPGAHASVADQDVRICFKSR